MEINRHSNEIQIIYLWDPCDGQYGTLGSLTHVERYLNARREFTVQHKYCSTFLSLCIIFLSVILGDKLLWFLFAFHDAGIEYTSLCYLVRSCFCFLFCFVLLLFCYRLQVPFKETNPKSPWPCVIVMPLPPPWPAWAAHSLLEKDGFPSLTLPLYNLFPMQIRDPAQDQSEDQTGSPLRSYCGIWRLSQNELGSFF